MYLFFNCIMFIFYYVYFLTIRSNHPGSVALIKGKNNGVAKNQ